MSLKFISLQNFFFQNKGFHFYYCNYCGGCLNGMTEENICHATRIEEDPKATRDIRCLQQGGVVALIQTKQQFPQLKR